MGLEGGSHWWYLSLVPGRNSLAEVVVSRMCFACMRGTFNLNNFVATCHFHRKDDHTENVFGMTTFVYCNCRLSYLKNGSVSCMGAIAGHLCTALCSHGVCLNAILHVCSLQCY